LKKVTAELDKKRIAKELNWRGERGFDGLEASKRKFSRDEKLGDRMGQMMGQLLPRFLFVPIDRSHFQFNLV
jgi:hypothetical protein